MNELKIINGKNNLIICFGGLSMQFGGVLPFEFLNHLSSLYKETSDLIFYTDKHQCSYQKGIHNISTNIDETITYLNSIIESKKYKKVILMGVSSGGYISILFGSLCNNVTNVIAFIPQTILKKPICTKYANLKNIINNTTQYNLHGDTSIRIKNDAHHISHCTNIEHYDNVNVIKHDKINMKTLRDNGFIKKLLDDIFYS